MWWFVFVSSLFLAYTVGLSRNSKKVLMLNKKHDELEAQNRKLAEIIVKQEAPELLEAHEL